MEPFGILADDLTGALDAALPFARRGYRTVMLLDAETGISCDILTLSTDSRSEPAAVASEKAAQGVRLLREQGVRRFYKKIDSTLRGAVSAEIEAALSECKMAAALICPAFPAQGRIVRDGILYVYGIPLDQSPFGSSGAGGSYIPALFQEVSDLPVAHLSLLTVDYGVRAMKDAIQSAVESGHRLLCADAAEDLHLQAIALALSEFPDILPCGSAGLAHGLAETFSEAPWKRSPLYTEKPALIVAGSQHPATKIQVLRLTEAGIPCIRWPAGASEEGWHPTVAGQDVAIELALAETERERFRDSAFRERLFDEMAGVVASLVPEVGAFIISGGETARTVLKALKARAIEIHSAVFPGVPASRIIGGDADRMPLITKAGGFGEPVTLLRALSHLKGA